MATEVETEKYGYIFPEDGYRAKLTDERQIKLVELANLYFMALNKSQREEIASFISAAMLNTLHPQLRKQIEKQLEISSKNDQEILSRLFMTTFVDLLNDPNQNMPISSVPSYRYTMEHNNLEIYRMTISGKREHFVKMHISPNLPGPDQETVRGEIEAVMPKLLTAMTGYEALLPSRNGPQSPKADPSPGGAK
jgi:hypothetical protein